MQSVADEDLSEIEAVLENLAGEVEGILATLVLTRAGLPICSKLVKDDVDEAYLSASLGTLLSVTVELSDKVFMHQPSRVIIDTKLGSMILRDINEDILIVIIFKKQHLGSILLILEYAAGRIAQLLS
jgi:predicted regulator of Ras-like GTPase activity (Roadblock/LC7/MglB family)